MGHSVMMNSVILIGRLTKDPTLRGEDNKIGLFTIAVNRNFTNQDGKREADFIQLCDLFCYNQL
jgi:single-strand DNA-binding protein